MSNLTGQLTDTDHCLVVAKLRERLGKQTRITAVCC